MRQSQPPLQRQNEQPTSGLGYRVKKLWPLFIVPLLLLGVVLGDFFRRPPAETSASLETRMSHAMQEGSLVLPSGGSAYDLWRQYVQDHTHYPALHREIGHTLFMQLRERGEQFFQRLQETVPAENEARHEGLRVYEAAIYVQMAQTHGKVDLATPVQQLCLDVHKDMPEEMQRLCARYSYLRGHIDFSHDRLHYRTPFAV
jgi:hypothetical protein